METTEKKTTENKTNDATLKIGENWEAKSKQLKAKFPQLTDTDLKFETGKESELLTRIETRLNKQHSEVLSIIKGIQTEKV